jgi:hypothetical protein
MSVASDTRRHVDMRWPFEPSTTLDPEGQRGAMSRLAPRRTYGFSVRGNGDSA